MHLVTVAWSETWTKESEAWTMYLTVVTWEKWKNLGFNLS